MFQEKTGFKITHTGTIITYDLSENDVSASKIAEQSKNLFTTINNTKSGECNLPSTTLRSTLKTIKEAIDEFHSAFSKTGSKSEIKRLFVVEVFEKNAYIENNE